MKRLGLILAALLVMGAAGDPAERLPDPVQEARARALFKELRCLQCQSESIDESNAEFARDLRRTVRERIAAGETDQQVLDYLQSRFDDYVLMRPRLTLTNALLWAGPFLVVILGGGLLALRLRKREPEAALGPEEDEELEALLKQDDKLAP